MWRSNRFWTLFAKCTRLFQQQYELFSNIVLSPLRFFFFNKENTIFTSTIIIVFLTWERFMFTCCCRLPRVETAAFRDIWRCAPGGAPGGSSWPGCEGCGTDWPCSGMDPPGRCKNPAGFVVGRGAMSWGFCGKPLIIQTTIKVEVCYLVLIFLSWDPYQKCLWKSLWIRWLVEERCSKWEKQ